MSIRHDRIFALSRPCDCHTLLEPDPPGRSGRLFDRADRGALTAPRSALASPVPKPWRACDQIYRALVTAFKSIPHGRGLLVDPGRRRPVVRTCRCVGRRASIYLLVEGASRPVWSLLLSLEPHQRASRDGKIGNRVHFTPRLILQLFMADVLSDTSPPAVRLAVTRSACTTFPA